MSAVSFAVTAAPPLKMHIYEQKPKVASQQGHRALAAVHHDEPLVTYNGVDFYIGAAVRRDKLFDQKFHSNQLAAELTVHLPNTWFIASRASYGEINSGRVIDGGDLFDASISFGKVLARQSPFSAFDRVEWRPQLGYSYHEQDVDLYQKSASARTKWHGPWLGYGGRLISEADFIIGMDLFYQ